MNQYKCLTNMAALKRTVTALFFAVASIIGIEAFSIQAFQPINGALVGKRNRVLGGSSKATLSDDIDCGCQTQIKFSGNPPEKARTLNHREVLREHQIYNVDGETIKMDQLIGEPTSNQVSVVVFLRSLG
mmetsp:Transcript_32931/g.93628  ORF Transcript_32931/g.93628 Transcript_32931/m.93628 type:complete len:130 (+) Transcript_32931:60-449(+)